MKHIGQHIQKGFTLIELLVVVLIIGILAAVAVPQYKTAVLKSRVSGTLVRLGSLKKAVDAYELANGLSDNCRNNLTFIGPDSNASLDIDLPLVACKGVMRSDGPLVECDDNNFDYNVYASCGMQRVQVIDMNTWDAWFGFLKFPASSSYETEPKWGSNYVGKGNWFGVCYYPRGNTAWKNVCNWLKESQGFFVYEN